MPNEVSNETPQFGPGNGSLILPCAPEQFAKFVSDLLGKPQIIRRRFYGAFDIQFEDVESIYHLIDHRLREQNGAQLVQFSVTISYNDQSSTTINGFDEFKRFSEIKHVETLSVNASFEYLIRFQGRGHPEKQTIDIGFVRDDLSHFEEEELSFLARSFFGRGRIFLVISHTARSWGADMEALLSQHLKGMLKEENVWAKLGRKYSVPCGILAGLFVFLGGLVTISLLLRYSASKMGGEALGLLQKIHDAESAARLGIPFLLRQTSDRWSEGARMPATMLVLVLTLGGAFAIFAFVERKLSNSPPAFLSFTKADKARKPILQKRYTNSKISAAIAAIASLAYGVLGNYVFHLIALHYGWAN